jgi:hypothetical protein
MTYHLKKTANGHISTCVEFFGTPYTKGFMLTFKIVTVCSFAKAERPTLRPGSHKTVFPSVNTGKSARLFTGILRSFNTLFTD